MSNKRTKARFEVWEGIAGHPTFSGNASALRIYLQAIGWAVAYGRMPGIRTVQRWCVSDDDMVGLGALLKDRAFVADMNVDQITINHTFGESGRRLFWAAFGSSRDSRAKPRERRSIDVGLRFEILRRDGFRCVYCGAVSGAKQLHVDHVMPVAAGGNNDHQNLVTACIDCNLGKSDTLIEEPLQ